MAFLFQVRLSGIEGLKVQIQELRSIDCEIDTYFGSLGIREVHEVLIIIVTHPQ